MLHASDLGIPDDTNPDFTNFVKFIADYFPSLSKPLTTYLYEESKSSPESHVAWFDLIKYVNEKARSTNGFENNAKEFFKQMQHDLLSHGDWSCQRFEFW